MKGSAGRQGGEVGGDGGLVGSGGGWGRGLLVMCLFDSG